MEEPGGGSAKVNESRGRSLEEKTLCPPRRVFNGRLLGAVVAPPDRTPRSLTRFFAFTTPPVSVGRRVARACATVNPYRVLIHTARGFVRLLSQSFQTSHNDC